MNEDINTEFVLKGDRFITTEDIKTTGLTTWAAPATGSFECIIPQGTILVAERDQVKVAKGFACVPEQYKELEKKLVPASDRFQLKYGGYYFVLLNDDIDSKLKFVSHATVSDRKRYRLKAKVQGWFRDIVILQALMIIPMYVIIILSLPFKPFFDFYRKRKLDARRKAEEQNNK